jgi:hypothetical protein
VLARRTEERWHCAGAIRRCGVTAGHYNGVVVGGWEEARRRRTHSRADTVCVCMCVCSCVCVCLEAVEGGREGGRVARLAAAVLCVLFVRCCCAMRLVCVLEIGEKMVLVS